MSTSLEQTVERATALRHVHEQLTAALDLSDSLEEHLLSTHVALALDTVDGMLTEAEGHR